MLVGLLLFFAFVVHCDAYGNSLVVSPKDQNVDCHAFPVPMSYHAHITYMLTNDNQINKASELRRKALHAFADLLGDNP